MSRWLASLPPTSPLEWNEFARERPRMNRLKSLAGFVLSGSPAEPANAPSRGGRRPTSLNINPPKGADAQGEPSGQADEPADAQDDDDLGGSASRDESAAGDASDHGGDDPEGGNDDPGDEDVGDLQEEEDELEQEEQEDEADDKKNKNPQQKRRRRKVVSSSDDDDNDNNAGSDGDDDDDGARAKRLRRNAPRKSKNSATAAVTAAASKSTRSLTPRRPRKRANNGWTRKKATKVSKRRKGTAAAGEREEVDELEEEEEEVAEEGEEEEEDGDAMDDSASSSEDDLVQLTEAEIADLENPELVQHFTKLRSELFRLRCPSPDLLIPLTDRSPVSAPAQTEMLTGARSGPETSSSCARRVAATRGSPSSSGSGVSPDRFLPLGRDLRNLIPPSFLLVKQCQEGGAQDRRGRQPEREQLCRDPTLVAVRPHRL